MPRKGTETYIAGQVNRLWKIWKWDAPEGDGNFFLWFPVIHCKQIWKWDAPEGDGNTTPVSRSIMPPRFGNEMPRKGTETKSVTYIKEIGVKDLEMRCPGRGRKQNVQLLKNFIV